MSVRPSPENLSTVIPTPRSHGMRAVVVACVALIALSGCSAPSADGPEASTQGGLSIEESEIPESVLSGPEPFLTSGWNIRTDIVSPFEDRVQVDPSETHVDENGVAVYEHYQTGEVEYHPIYIAQHAMGALSEYEQTRDQKWLEMAERNGQKLVDTHTEYDGAWWFQYEFDWTYLERTLTAPWWSGMAQGEALTVFSRLALLDPENPIWREAADRTFDSFLRRGEGNEHPWVTATIDGELWFEEYAGDQPPLQVLNGQVFAIFGLWEYWNLTADPRAERYIDGGATTVLQIMPRVRNEGGVSYYCVQRDYCRTPDWLNEAYHPIHIQQLNALGRMTGDDRFVQWAEILESDWQPDPEESR